MTEHAVDLVIDPLQRGLTTTLFHEALLAFGAISRRTSWMSQARDLDVLLQHEDCESHLVQRFGDHVWMAYVTFDDLPAEIELDMGQVTVSVGGREGEVFDTLDGVFAKIREIFPVSEAGDLEVPFTFWMNTQHGPNSIQRRLAAVDWADIDLNYSVDTRSDLLTLMEGFTPALGGQLLIWHGPPGTGKTFALRALSWEWRSWCDMHYIADPEEFFGQASYLLHVLLQETPTFVEVKSSGEPDTTPPPRQRWRCLILEDTGELLAADAKEKTGQGLSRLLNVVDGLIGQGLRILVLVTTNEELGKLHEAVLRPGRCAMQTEFAQLTADEAQAWREKHAFSGSSSGAKYLAELYAETDGFYNRHEPTKVGFAR